jgi:alkanesulfonate monooxygenase SsuD/methylene tetrahydromethanopterin reductase-like flavin-dependent oxidoreductase (luciferase family)
VSVSEARYRPLKLGIILPVAEYRMDGKTPRWTDLLAMSRRAEEIGFGSNWIVDHLIVAAQGQETIGVWECWSLLSALAAATSRVELGTLVVCAGFRNPALLAKMAETVDEISGGRLILGLGAGNHEPEFRAFGFPYDHRAGRFEEAIQIIHPLLRTGEADFTGRYSRAEQCVLRPRGPRPDGPPIMIGTTGERMLRLTARYADSWNAYFSDTGNRASGVAPLRERVDAACRAEGRDPGTLERTVSVLVGALGQRQIEGIGVPPLAGTPEEIAAEFRAYRAEGIDHLQIRVEPNTVAGIESLAPVLELLR